MKRASSFVVFLAVVGWAVPSAPADGPSTKPSPAADKEKDKKAKDKAAKAKKPASPAPKVFTDDDLKKYSDDPEGTAKKKTEGEAAPASAPAEEANETAQDAEFGGKQVWVDRAEGVRDRINQAQATVANLEAKIAQLRNDRGVEGAMEPFRLQRIEADIAKALGELEAANKELSAAQAAQEKLFQEARQRGVPMGWVREP